jgi:uncharacterized membrane-anchored protein YhcB (DUF1043 family)
MEEINMTVLDWLLYIAIFLIGTSIGAICVLTAIHYADTKEIRQQKKAERKAKKAAKKLIKTKELTKAVAAELYELIKEGE